MVWTSIRFDSTLIVAKSVTVCICVLRWFLREGIHHIVPAITIGIRTTDHACLEGGAGLCWAGVLTFCICVVFARPCGAAIAPCIVGPVITKSIFIKVGPLVWVVGECVSAVFSGPETICIGVAIFICVEASEAVSGRCACLTWAVIRSGPRGVVTKAIAISVCPLCCVIVECIIQVCPTITVSIGACVLAAKGRVACLVWTIIEGIGPTVTVGIEASLRTV